MPTIAEQVYTMRRRKDAAFHDPAQSPLTIEQQALFQGLRYYDYAPQYRFILTPEIFAHKDNIKLQTTTGEIRYYVRWGRVTFTIDDQTASLTLFLLPGSAEFFVPFKDATNGLTTYPAGRYLEISLNEDDTVTLDFNLAYSPFCAYNEPIELAKRAARSPRIWNCSIPPLENRLSIAIEVGEQAPSGAWVITDHGI